MLSWIMLIIALVLFSVLGVWLFSAVFGRGEALPPMEDTADVKEANRLAVEAGTFDDIQLEVVHRGYRMDQVDALIAQLTGADPASVDTRAEREIAAPALEENSVEYRETQ
ncbi:cell division protein DivIVA [Corynebacterium aquatimens]|uniref:cell division protein DivIVA n=1 Tax=Corynebacterium aquatimens TaxID=1190508 RepID=UPI00253FEF7A|nr:cell division protein DivIVA [Corynebacterium aquatimens]QYH19932.1 cell division protein DivIVA [Corynebacterium aquatimens]